MTTENRLESFAQTLAEGLGDSIVESWVRLGELTVVLDSRRWHESALRLRDQFGFEQLIDLCGIDYSTYPGWDGPRFGVVVHLLSIRHNRRLRVRLLLEDGPVPQIATVEDLWSVANWFEREAFDLFGIVFAGNSDLRRLLTDYGFVGHPFRKDFPVSGHVEMRYDPALGRVVYQPVTVVPREVTPRKWRPENYGDTENHG